MPTQSHGAEAGHGSGRDAHPWRNRIFWALGLLLLLAILLLSAVDTASARTRCVVTDPTGTPLNVRASPNGRIINRLRNGRVVYILALAPDNRGRPWAHVGGNYKGRWRVWGWVFREFISCY